MKPLSNNETKTKSLSLIGKAKLSAIILLVMMLCSGCGKVKNRLFEYQVKRGERIERKYTKQLENQGAKKFTVHVGQSGPNISGRLGPVTLILHGEEAVSLPRLSGMNIDRIVLDYTGVSDLSPVVGVNGLSELYLDNAPVADLSPLKGIKLKKLGISRTKITDLSPLKGMPLRYLYLEEAEAIDLSPLKGMQLEFLMFTPQNITNGIDIVRNMSSLDTLGTNSSLTMPPAEFWAKFDAGEFD